MNANKLSKDGRTNSIVRRLADKFGARNFKIRDHRDVDFNAIGLYLVYNFDQDLENGSSIQMAKVAIGNVGPSLLAGTLIDGLIPHKIANRAP